MHSRDYVPRRGFMLLGAVPTTFVGDSFPGNTLHNRNLAVLAHAGGLSQGSRFGTGND